MRSATCAIDSTTIRLFAPCTFFVLATAMLIGCSESSERCEGRAGEPVAITGAEPWGSEAHRRAATAIDCDAYEIMGRIAELSLPPHEVGAFQTRTRDLARLALDTVQSGPVESSRLPLSSAHQQMYEIAAEAERMSGSAPLIVWAANPWEPLHPLERPPDNIVGALSTSLMRRERRALAFNVRSTSSAPLNLAIQINLPGFPPDAMHIYRVNWTGNDASSWAAAELESLGDASSVRDTLLLPGVTQQIWVQVHSDASARSGVYSGSIHAAADARQAVPIPLIIQLFKIALPARLSTHFGGWDYADGSSGYAVTDLNRLQLIEHLQTRHVDTPWAQRGVMRWDHIDANGRIDKPIDSTALERWLSEWPRARRYRVFLSVSDAVAGMPATTDHRFTRIVSTWAQSWAAEIWRLGKSPAQFDLLLVDEPQTEAQAQTTQVWANAIRQSGADFQIWTDPNWRDASHTPQSMIDAVDTISINLQIAEQGGPAYWSWVHGLSQQGKAIEVYACEGPARRLDPYVYYRMAFWRAFFIEATAVTFWSFSDNRNTSADNEFASRDPNYSPLFINDGQIRPGKHMEAAVEGLQDGEYLRMLKQVATTHSSTATQARAEALLDGAAELLSASARVSDSQWRFQIENSEADRRRIEIGEFLDFLSP